MRIKLESPLPKDALCQFSWNWPSGFGEEDFKFLLFRNYLLLIKGGALHLNQLEISLPKDTLCQVWLKLAKWFWSRYHLPLEKSRDLHLNKLEFPTPKDALCQVWLNCPAVLERKIFKNFINGFSLFRNYLPLEKGGALHLNKLESPSPKNVLCQVQVVLKKKIF